MPRLDTLQDLYLDELRELYQAEFHMRTAWSEVVSLATSPKLQRILEKDMLRTHQHAQWLDEIFEVHQQAPSGRTCRGMEGLLQEGRDRLQHPAHPHVMDAELIVMAQKAQHYRMAGYGSAGAFANQLGREQEANLLQQAVEAAQSLDEEFTAIASGAINLGAVGAVAS